MTPYQKSLFAEIQAMKRDPRHDKKQLKKMVKWLTEEDDRTGELKAQQRVRRGQKSKTPGSRNPHYGWWRTDDK